MNTLQSVLILFAFWSVGLVSAENLSSKDSLITVTSAPVSVTAFTGCPPIDSGAFIVTALTLSIITSNSVFSSEPSKCSMSIVSDFLMYPSLLGKVWVLRVSKF